MVTTTKGLSLFDLLKNVDFINHIEGIDKGSGKLLKEWQRIQVKPISMLCNLSMALGSFPGACKISKVKTTI